MASVRALFQRFTDCSASAAVDATARPTLAVLSAMASVATFTLLRLTVAFLPYSSVSIFVRPSAAALAADKPIGNTTVGRNGILGIRLKCLDQLLLGGLSGFFNFKKGRLLGLGNNRKLLARF